MSSRSLLSSKWVRLVVFLWMFVFPIVFIALPLLKVITDDAALTMRPLWAFVLWVLTPAAVAIGMNYFANGKSGKEEDKG